MANWGGAGWREGDVDVPSHSVNIVTHAQDGGNRSNSVHSMAKRDFLAHLGMKAQLLDFYLGQMILKAPCSLFRTSVLNHLY